MRVRVLGVGSPSGDDTVGWMVVEALQKSSLPARLRRIVELEPVALDRPGMELVRHLSDVDLVIVVDAVVGKAPPGTIERIETHELQSDFPMLSCHGFGVAGALDLARTLGTYSADVVVLGIHIPSPRAGASIDPTVRAAVSRVLGMIEAILDDKATGNITGCC